MLLKRLILINPKRLAVSFTSIFGLVWLFLEPLGLFQPDLLNWGWWGYISLILVSLLFSIYSNLPQRRISRSLSSPDSIVEIKIGDLFNEPGHLVIGLNDVFDTEIGDVIKASSVQGQFLTKRYYGDQKKLDHEISENLKAFKSVRKRDPGKSEGKIWRYPIGTTIVLGSSDTRYFLNAYGYMGNNLRVRSNADDIWHSLSCLWEKVRLKGHGLEVSIPVIGSDLARTNLPRMALIELIIISFIAASKQGFVTKKLKVIIYPKDLETVDFQALDNFLEMTCF